MLLLAGYGLLLTLALVGWARYAVTQPSVTAYAYRYDFVSLYGGARLVWTGQSAALYDPAAQARVMDAATAPYTHPLLLPYVTPGYVALALAPLGALPYGAAFVLWGLVNGALIAWAIGRLVRLTTSDPAGRLVAAVTLAAAMPVLLVLLQGQITGVVLLGVTEALVALHAGQERRAGLWLLLGLVKPHLLLVPLLALLLTGRGRTVATFAAGTVGITALSVLILGNWIGPFLAVTLGSLQAGAVAGDYPTAMQNWRALVAVGVGDVPALVAALSVLSVAVVGWLARRAPFAVVMAGALLVGLLVSPHLYLHDVALALPAGCLLWRAAPRLRPLLAAGPGVLWVAQFTAVGIGPLYLAALVAGGGLTSWPALCYYRGKPRRLGSIELVPYAKEAADAQTRRRRPLG